MDSKGIITAFTVAVVILVMALVIFLPAEDEDVVRNASIEIPRDELTIGTRMGSPVLRVMLLDDDMEHVKGATGAVELLGRSFELEEENGTYRAIMDNVSAGTHHATVKMARYGYDISDAGFQLKVRFSRVIEGDKIDPDLPRLPFVTTRPEVCRAQPAEDGWRIDVLFDGSRMPLVRFELAFPEPLDLSTFHSARINASFVNTPDLSLGLIDSNGQGTWYTLNVSGGVFEWEFDEHEEDLLRTSWDGLWGGLVPRHLEPEYIDFTSISRLVFKTTQRRDGLDHSITLHDFSIIREPIEISVCPPTLREAINTTLSIRSDPFFIHPETGLPYEFINIRDMVVPSSSDLDFTIGNNEIGEGHSSHWMYYFGSGERWVGEFMHNVSRNMALYLDPGNGLIGLHHYDRRTGELESDTHRTETECTFEGGPAGESSAQHGGEEPMYMMMPAAWHFGEEEAIMALERYSRTMLELNSDPRMVHFHLYVKRCDDEWSVGDWDGEHGDDIVILDPDPSLYTDLSEFWWITPMLGTAMVTGDEELKKDIVDRCSRVIDNVIHHQDADGRIPYVYRMDGTEARHEPTALGWSGYNLDSFFARSSYLLHNLTGEERYLDALERMYDYFLDGHVPTLYYFASQVIFHAHYTGDDSRVEPLIEHIRENYPLERIENDIYACTWALFPWVWNGSTRDLQIALEGESRFRSRNWVPIPYGSDNHHLYQLSSADTIIDWGWCPLDKFGSGAESFYALLQLGSGSRGLIGRDLLTLGMFADIPDYLGPVN